MASAALIAAVKTALENNGVSAATVSKITADLTSRTKAVGMVALTNADEDYVIYKLSNGSSGYPLRIDVVGDAVDGVYVNGTAVSTPDDGGFEPYVPPVQPPTPGTDPVQSTPCSSNPAWQGPTESFLTSIGVSAVAAQGIVANIAPKLIETESGIEVQLRRWAKGPVAFGLFYPTARASVHVRQRMGSYPQPANTEQVTKDWFYKDVAFAVPVADGDADWLTIYIRANGTIEQWRRGVLVV